MKHLYLILFFSIVSIGTTDSLFAQDIIYDAIFSGNGSRNGRAEGIIGGNWTAIAQNGCTNDGNEFFGTRNGSFEITNFDGSGCGANGEGGANNSEWRSSIINIRNYVNISVSIELSGIAGGDGFEGNPLSCSGAQGSCIDKFTAMVTIDGETYFSQSYSLNGNSFNFTFDEGQGICGNQMLIRVRGGTQSADESIFIDRVLVTGDRGRRPTAPQPRDFCEGEDGVLQIINVSPNAKIVWFGPDGDEITPYANKDKLQIKNLRIEDTGLYSAFVLDPDQGCVTPILLDYDVYVFPTFPDRVRLEIPDGSICEGEDITLKASPTGTNYEYTWIGPDNQEIVEFRNSDTCFIEDVSIDDQGAYLVLVSNPNFGECGVGEDENELSVNQGPGQVDIQSSTYCIGSTATIEVTTENPGNYIYTWILPDGSRRTTTQTSGTLTINNIQFRHQGHYLLLVSNPDGSCEKTIGNGINLTINNSIGKPEIDILSTSCSDFPTLEATSQSKGTVYWYDEEGNLVATGEATYQPTQAGKYYAVIVDSTASCQSPPSDLFEVFEIETVEAEVNALESQICSDTQTTLIASGGTQFQWSTGANTASITVGIGNYRVTVSNAQGCEDEANFTVESFPDFEVEIEGTNPICFGTTTALNATGGQSYLWNNGATTSTVTVVAGNYEVTVTDENGCQISSDFRLDYFDTSEVEITGEDQICEGGQSTISASRGESYLWSTGATSQSINVEEGNYSVTVTDVNSCAAEATFQVEQLPDFQVQIDGLTQICEGEQTMLTATTGTMYLWNNGATSKSIEVGAGNYSVTVTNAGGCEANNDVRVLESEIPSFSIENAAICATTLDRYQITISTSATNQLSTNNGNILQEDNGIYLIEIAAGEDFNFRIESGTGCFITETISAPNCSCPNLVAPSNNGNLEVCEGEDFPKLQVGNTTENLIINWYDAPNGGNLVQANSTSFQPQMAGTFYAEAMDETNNCRSARTPVTLTVNSLPEINITEKSNIDCRESFGNLTVLGAGGTAPYEYALNNTRFTSENSFYNLIEGNHQIRIRDAKSCANQVSTEIITNRRTDEQRITQYSCDAAALGTETIRLTNNLGCDSLIIITTLNGSSVPIFLSETTCDPTQAAVDTTFLSNEYGCDSLIITNYTFIPSDTTEVKVTSCNPEDVGQNTMTFQNQYGCDSVVVVTIEYATENMVLLDVLSCEPSEVGRDTAYYINQFGCDSIVVTDTKLRGNGHSEISFMRKMTCDFGEIGLDTVHLQNQHGCDSIIVLDRYFGFPPPPQLNITRDQRMCRGDTILLTTDSYSTNLQWLKDERGIEGETSNSFYITESGGYAVSHINDEGCVVVSDIVYVMVMDTPPIPIFNNTNNFLQLETAVDSQAVVYQWFLNGEPIEEATNVNFCTKKSGIYTLIATNEDTECSSSYSIEIIHDPDVEACLVNVDDFSERIQFKVYPNPHMEQFRIEYDLGYAVTVEIKIFDVVGKVRYRQREKAAAARFSHSIITKSWEEGIYFLQINVEGVNYIHKIVKGKWK